jgi:hypothetical protein
VHPLDGDAVADIAIDMIFVFMIFMGFALILPVEKLWA